MIVDLFFCAKNELWSNYVLSNGYNYVKKYSPDVFFYSTADSNDSDEDEEGEK